MVQNKVRRVTCVSNPSSNSMTYRDCEISTHQIAKKYPCRCGYVDINNPAIASNPCIQGELNDRRANERLHAYKLSLVSDEFRNTTFFFVTT